MPTSRRRGSAATRTCSVATSSSKSSGGRGSLRRRPARREARHGDAQMVHGADEGPLQQLGAQVHGAQGTHPLPSRLRAGSAALREPTAPGRLRLRRAERAPAVFEDAADLADRRVRLDAARTDSTRFASASRRGRPSRRARRRRRRLRRARRGSAASALDGVRLGLGVEAELRLGPARLRSSKRFTPTTTSSPASIRFWAS